MIVSKSNDFKVLQATIITLLLNIFGICDKNIFEKQTNYLKQRYDQDINALLNCSVDLFDNGNKLPENGLRELQSLKVNTQSMHGVLYM